MSSQSDVESELAALRAKATPATPGIESGAGQAQLEAEPRKQEEQ
jgi:hypothetical protein